MLYEYGKRTRDFFEAFLFFLKFSLLYFGGVFNKTIIPLAVVGYEMITANSALCERWLSTISYPTRACGIIVNYDNFTALLGDTTSIPLTYIVFSCLQSSCRWPIPVQRP